MECRFRPSRPEQTHFQQISDAVIKNLELKIISIHFEIQKNPMNPACLSKSVTKFQVIRTLLQEVI